MSSAIDLGVRSVRGRRKQAKPQRKKGSEPDSTLNTAATQDKVESVEEAGVQVKGARETMPPEGSHPVACTPEPGSSGDENSVDRNSRIKELLRRKDTALVLSELPQGTQLSVPLSKERTSPVDLQEDCFIKCTFCGQSLPSFQVLKEHMDSNHPGGAFPCVHCAATFPSRDQLERHEQLHAATQQVSCKVCNKTFANVYRLHRHMISHDESAVLRKFKCPQCEKAFKFKHHLKEHIRIHSGEKPFQCRNCEKRFSHSGSYSSHMTSKKCLITNLKVNRGLNRALELKHPSTLRSQASVPTIKQSPNHNNNFAPILPKYTEGTASFLSNFSQQNQTSGLYPFFFPPFSPSQNLPAYMLPTTINNLIDHLNKKVTPIPIQNDARLPEGGDHETNASEDIVIKEEIQDECREEEEVTAVYPERQPSGNCKRTDLEEVNKILDTVSARVTKQFLQENMQKMSPESCNSRCPSDESEAATPSVEDKSETLSCRFCRKEFTSGIELHQHERYLCNGNEEKNEGLAAKLEEVVMKTEPNGVSCSGSEDETRESREIMTEDEDCDTLDQDGRKIRVRSQISEDQLIILKQNYTVNPRPKREELSRIADHVGLAVRVVQVWFQNNRARDRREGRLVHVPYVATNWYPQQSTLPTMEQPLDLSTKKSQGSSSPGSPPRSDTEEAVNLIQKSPFLRPNFQQRSPSPLETSRLARMLTLPSIGRFPSNGSSPMFYASPDQSASRSPIPAIALYNGNSSPNPGSEIWWKRNLMETQEADEFGYAEDFNKRFKAAEPDTDGQLTFNCDQCEKAFSKQSSLTRHRYEHSGQRPHKCDMCGKAFKHKHHLTEHKRLHSGEKPFQCPKCLKRFSHSGSYSQHMNHRYSYCKPYRE